MSGPIRSTSLRPADPFLKWAGGKRRLVQFIAEHLPLTENRRLVEPFAGGAAVSLRLGPRVQSLWLNDANADLMLVYRLLKENPEAFIAAARPLFASQMNDSDTYYRLRDRFNAIEIGLKFEQTGSARGQVQGRGVDVGGATVPDSALERAALFLYLNRHGYNGLCRYNSAGHFNVPYGRYKRPYFPEEELRAAAALLQRARVTQLDFEQVLAECGAGDVVYCDPPYVPLSPTASFTDYAAGGFDMEDQERLAKAVVEAGRRGVFVAVSNHDTPETRALYAGARFYERAVRRTISCDGNNRNKVMELLAVFAPEG